MAEQPKQRKTDEREMRRQRKRAEGMNIFGITGRSDKDLFVCFYPEWQEKRVSSTFWDDFSIDYLCHKANGYGNETLEGEEARFFFSVLG